IAYLIENRLIDVIVSTGANLYHDVYESLGFRHSQGDPQGDDVRLAHLRVVRFYDVLAPEHEFARAERFCTEFSLTLDDGRPYTTREYFDLLGKAMAPVAKEGGILTAAAKHGVPIYCPAFGDSVHGLAVAEGRHRTGRRLMFDVTGDVLEMIHLSITAKNSAADRRRRVHLRPRPGGSQVRHPDHDGPTAVGRPFRLHLRGGGLVAQDRPGGALHHRQRRGHGRAAVAR
ncbi:MAG: hypothetical protein E6J43_12885, partial [Chloroflexi bacterium]